MFNVPKEGSALEDMIKMFDEWEKIGDVGTK